MMDATRREPRYRRNAASRDEGMVKLQTRMPPGLLAELEEAAAAELISKTAMTERFIRQGLARLRGETA
jgi:hypothetical protein